MGVTVINQPILLGTISFTAALAAQNAFAEIEISSAPTQNMSCSAGVCRPTGHNPVLNVSDLAALLVSSDVVVALRPSARRGQIAVLAPLNWTSTHKLTLEVNYPYQGA